MDRGYAKRKLLKKDTQKAAVFGAVLICAAAFTAALTGCVSTQAETEKIRDMKYEVIEEEDIPQSLREMIKGGEKKPFRITYSDQGFLYIAQGYGLYRILFFPFVPTFLWFLPEKESVNIRHQWLRASCESDHVPNLFPLFS